MMSTKDNIHNAAATKYGTDYAYTVCMTFFKVHVVFNILFYVYFYFILILEQERGAERENLKQSPGSRLSEEPDEGLHPMTLGS